MSIFFFSLFSIFGLFFSFLVISSINPVNSVLFLVSSFVCFSVILFLLQLEFIPLMFIIIYVGAIAILFLFVVMMLNIKLATKTSDFFKYFPFGSLIALFFWVCILFQLNQNLIAPQITNKLVYQEHFWFLFLDSVTNLEVLGQVLYTYYFLFFLLGGIILLVAMIGSIVLTFPYNKKVKIQYLFRQLSRNQKTALFFLSNS